MPRALQASGDPEIRPVSASWELRIQVVVGPSLVTPHAYKAFAQARSSAGRPVLIQSLQWPPGPPGPGTITNPS